MCDICGATTSKYWSCRLGDQLGGWALGGTPLLGSVAEEFCFVCSNHYLWRCAWIVSTALLEMPCFFPVFPLKPRTARQDRVSRGYRVSESESFLRQTLSNPYLRVRAAQTPTTSVTTHRIFYCWRKNCNLGCLNLAAGEWLLLVLFILLIKVCMALIISQKCNGAWHQCKAPTYIQPLLLFYFITHRMQKNHLVDKVPIYLQIKWYLACSCIPACADIGFLDALGFVPDPRQIRSVLSAFKAFISFPRLK